MCRLYDEKCYIKKFNSEEIEIRYDVFCECSSLKEIIFDDFTAIMLYILSKIARFSDGIYINCPYGKGNKNSNI